MDRTAKIVPGKHPEKKWTCLTTLFELGVCGYRVFGGIVGLGTHVTATRSGKDTIRGGPVFLVPFIIASCILRILAANDAPRDVADHTEPDHLNELWGCVGLARGLIFKKDIYLKRY